MPDEIFDNASTHMGQAHNQRIRALTEFEHLGYGVRGTIVTHLDAIDSSAQSSAGPIRILRKDAIVALWERIQMLLAFYKGTWSVDDVAARLPAARHVYSKCPEAPATGTNWLQSVTSQVDTLTTTHGDALVDLGVTELNFIALMALIGMVVRWNLAHMVIGYRPVNFTIGDLFVFFFKLFACSLMLHYYFNPFPGTGISLHNLFASVAQAIASTLDQNIMNDFLTRVCKVGDSSERPVGLDLIGVIVYFGVMVSMALIDLAMFAVDAFGWVAYGLFSLFGPLAIPLYMTKNFSSKFWGWLDGLIVFSFYRAVSAGFSFIWLNVLVGFFDNTVAGDYSIGHWLAIFGTLIMLTGAFFWGMFKIPMITSMLFGGVGAAAQGFTSAVSGLITAAAEAALLA